MSKFIVCLILSAVFSLSSFSADKKLEDFAQETLAQKHKPQSIDIFKAVPHLPVINQDTTNACWSFATLSFLESEMHRLGLKRVKLAMMYPVYFSFIEKARHFVKTKGESRFGGGDLFSGVFETIIIRFTTTVVKRVRLPPSSLKRIEISKNAIRLSKRL